MYQFTTSGPLFNRFDSKVFSNCTFQDIDKSWCYFFHAAAKLTVLFEVNELLLQDEISGLFISHKNKFTLTKPASCTSIEKIEIYKRDKKVFLLIKGKTKH